MEDTLFHIEWTTGFGYAVKLVVAFGLSLPVAWDREHSTRIMGLRTYPLVSIAACAYLLVGQTIIGPDGSEGAHARVLQGLIGGIGFIGAGAILKNDDRVIGTATAAGIWNMGAVGAAIAYGDLEIAVLLVVVNLVVLQVLGRVKDGINGDGSS